MEVPQNVLLRGPAGLAKIWSGSAGVDYFPVKTTVQWLAWHAWGEHTAGYHSLSLGLHLLSAFLFWRLLAKLGVGAFGAWLGGLLFVVHPLAVESVAWISELKNTLSLPLLLLAMSSYLDFDQSISDPSHAKAQGRKENRRVGRIDLCDFATLRETALGTYVLTLALFILAMLSKSTVVMFPCAILLYAWWRRCRIARRDALASLPFFIVALVLGLVTVWFQEHRAIAGVPLDLGGLASRLAAAGLAIAFYLGKCVCPVGLEPIYPRGNVDPPSVWQFWPWAVMAVVGLVAQASRLPSSKRQAETPALLKHAALGLGWFLLFLLPVLGLVPMAYLRISRVADHFAYVSLLGVIGLAVAAFGTLFSSSGRGGRVAVAAAAACLIAALALFARRYDAVFRDDRALWTFALAHNPNAAMAHNNLGKVLFAEGRLAEAGGQFERAAALDPDDAESRFNHGLMLADAGRPEEAMAQFEAALRLRPAFPEAQDCLGNTLLALGRAGEAAACYQAALRLDPGYAEAHANLGVALAELGRPGEAEDQFEAALRLRPGYPEAKQNLERLRAGGVSPQ